PHAPKDRRIKVSMSMFTSKGAKAFEIGPIDATQMAATRPEAVPVQVQIPLKSMARGRYTCQITVVDELGRKFAFRRAPIVVL
ncbi:MAG: VWA domain-containing protein, partial [Bryobacteraceae bacterium]